MTNLPIIHTVPFNKMTVQEQYDLVQKTFTEALREIGTLPDEADRLRLRNALDRAMSKSTALSQHAALVTVRLIVRGLKNAQALAATAS